MLGQIDQAYEADDAQFDQASFQWISTQFDHPIHHLNELGGRIGQIGWKSIEIMLGQIDQAYEADDAQFDQASSQWISTQFDHPIHHLNELGGRIGQIGWKSIEIMLGQIDQAYEADDAQFDQASSQWISTQFDHPIHRLDQAPSQWISTQFDQASSQWISTKFDHPIQPVINAWSNWASSQWISTQFNYWSNSLLKNNLQSCTI